MSGTTDAKPTIGNATTADNAKAASSPTLPSTKESQRSAINQKFSSAMDTLQARVLTASQTLNDITGYTSIDGIKAENETLEKQLAEAQTRVREARVTYKTSNSKRAATQREVTTLLARKDSWSPTDLERFTELYRADHILESEAVAAQEALTTAEADEQSLNQRLNAGILKRYHEEQIWSDRIRQASTWGTWGLMAMNFLLFVVLQFFAEPWRRRRLIKGVVEQEAAVLDGVRAEMAALRESLEQRIDNIHAQAGGTIPKTKDSQADVKPPAAIPSPTPEAQTPGKAPASWQQWAKNPSQWRASAEDLVSDRSVVMRKRDASLLAAEGAAVGGALVASIIFFILRS